MELRTLSKLAVALHVVMALAVVTCFVAVPARADFGDELSKLTASDAIGRDRFGRSVAISADYAVVGALDKNSSAGAVYVFDIHTGQELRKLTASDAATGDLFGRVAISGNIALVGAQNNDDAGSNSGSAYLFDVTTGKELFKLTASDAAIGDQFGGNTGGAKFGISGNRAIIGASGKNGNVGAAYVFDITTGQELMKLTASDGGPGHALGAEADISEDTAILAGGGKAYLFDVTTGQELLKLTTANSQATGFGSSVAIDRDRAIVGSFCCANGGAGSAHVFDVTTGQELHELIAPGLTSGISYGNVVALSGNTAIVGTAFGEAAYLFDVTNGEFLAKISTSNSVQGPDPFGSVFGRTVAISGNTALVGDWASDEVGMWSGSAYLFDVSRHQPIPGDFNTDGTVNAADYIVWRQGLGTTYTQTDYDAWRANFGKTAAGTGDVAVSLDAGGFGRIPEPESMALLLLGLLAVFIAIRRTPFRFCCE